MAGSAGRSARPRIAVTGLGIVAANASSVAEFKEALLQGRCGMRPVRSFATGDYVNRYAGVVDEPELGARAGDVKNVLDRGAQLALSAAHDAVADAGLKVEPGAGAGTMVALGTSLGGWVSYLESLRRDHAADPATDFKGPHAGLIDVSPCRIASVLCDRFGVSGGSLTAVTACAAGANAITLGMDAIRHGRSDVVIVCATDPLCELSFSGFNILMAMTDTVSRPFDKNRSGLQVGEGAAAMILESMEHADSRRAQIYCEVAGYGLSNDAHHLTQPDPAGRGACRAISRALRDAGVGPGDVDYINAHGTSTRHNDLMEVKAIEHTYGAHARHVPVSSIKSMIGHTLGAAGAIEAVATILALHHRFLPPTVNHESPMDDYRYDFVPSSRPADRADVMSSHSFGFGGNAACLLFRSASPSMERRDVRGRRVLSGCVVADTRGTGTGMSSTDANVAARYGRHHFSGMDCRLTALRNLLDYFGIKESFAGVVGMSSSHGFTYRPRPLRGAERLLHPDLDFTEHFYAISGSRTDCIEQAATTYNAELEGNYPDDAERSLDRMRVYLREGVPVMVAVSRRALATRMGRAYDMPAFMQGIDFGGHWVVLAGIDDRRKTVTLFESDWPRPVELAQDEFRRLRCLGDDRDNCFMKSRNRWMAFVPSGEQPPRAQLVGVALAKCLFRLRMRGRGGSAARGLHGIRTLANELPGWVVSKELSLEKLRATVFMLRLQSDALGGGGLGRREFTKFLGGAARECRSDALASAAASCGRAGAGWDRLVARLTGVFEPGFRSMAADVGSVLRDIVDAEERVADGIEAYVGGK